MSAATDTHKTRREQAIRHCQEQINWYQKTKTRQRVLYQVTQVLALVLSGLTPILILWTDLHDALKALPAALAAIATALQGIFQWKDSYTRFAYAAEALKGELLRYQIRTTADYQASLDDEQALENFVARVEQIRMTEVGEWRAQMQQAGQANQ